jgi:mannose-6-phosphate isomerase-like protein (cupin superfamily)
LTLREFIRPFSESRNCQVPKYVTKSFVSHAKDATWTEGLRPYFRYRDLGAKEATGGDVLVHMLQARKACDGPMGYHSHILDFQMTIMLKGWARIELEDRGEFRVEAGDAWYQPSGIKHEVLEYSDDFEVIEITLPADFPTHEESR